jgi:hypothetical protein
MKDIPDDLKDLIKDKPTKDDYRKLGEYLIRKKINAIKMKWHSFRRFFSWKQNQNK